MCWKCNIRNLDSICDQYNGGIPMKNNVNVIAVLNNSKNKLLMCKRRNNPYQGLLNLVGGKIEPHEDSYNAAHRELFEETSITENDI